MASVDRLQMPHVHLVSSSRYPAIPRLDPNEVAKWLINAPHIARDKATVFWTYLDKPQDGTVLLTWQPLQRLGVNFATDGYIWAPPEQVFKHDLGNGLVRVARLGDGYESLTPLDNRSWRYISTRPASCLVSSTAHMPVDASDSFLHPAIPTLRRST